MKRKSSSKRLKLWLKQVIAEDKTSKLSSIDQKSLKNALKAIDHGLRTGNLTEVKKGIDTIALIFMN